MIKIENFEAIGWEHAIRGCRNPKNSWERSDTEYKEPLLTPGCYRDLEVPKIGPNDYDLMTRLCKAGTDHRKFMRMITVYVDITAPLYWWKEFDTYKVGTVANSCSTMHKIQDKEFTMEDFSCEHLLGLFNHDDERDVPLIDIGPYAGAGMMYSPRGILEFAIIPMLNLCRDKFNELDAQIKKLNIENTDLDELARLKQLRKQYWWQMIQLLPSNYNQKRTVMLNYEVLANMYKSRKHHKLDEWREFCKWIERLSYSELITGKVAEKE